MASKRLFLTRQVGYGSWWLWSTASCYPHANWKLLPSPTPVLWCCLSLFDHKLHLRRTRVPPTCRDLCSTQPRVASRDGRSKNNCFFSFVFLRRYYPDQVTDVLITSKGMFSAPHCEVGHPCVVDFLLLNIMFLVSDLSLFALFSVIYPLLTTIGIIIAVGCGIAHHLNLVTFCVFAAFVFWTDLVKHGFVVHIKDFRYVKLVIYSHLV